nr:MarR family transcriptional regulator [Kibdelosporangium sp. MJ126-NF4]CEL20601.1 Transcriptional regulator, MarR family [Kibdelosporangium sp. MJ126-NF4]CTQ89512.1 Transcriptional regulator, MarR family [Kibdelosporangium sp. MJ126-NF4]
MRRPIPRESRDPAESTVHVAEAPIGSALLRLVRAHHRLGTSLLAEIGLAPPQELILLRLEEYGTLPQSDIVRFLNRDRSTVSTTLQAMERAGLIVRTPSPTDRRALDATITKAGHALCPAIRDAWARLEEMSFGHLSATARTALVRAMSASRDALVESALRQRGN